MATVTIEVPDDAFSALRQSPKDFAREMRLAAAIQWYHQGLVSQEKPRRSRVSNEGSSSRLSFTRRSRRPRWILMR